jgi:arylsulfatase A-like enzyme
VLNYMEAHQPLIPSRAARAALMTPEQVAASYRVDRRWNAIWDYTFGLRDYSPDEIELTQLTYDAALRELDGAFGLLIDALRARGDLAHTIVVLVGDHGEQLGEHHMLEHQFSVYEPLMRVPLVLWYPERVRAGREGAPVTNMDLYPTLLELAGVPAPTASSAPSLLHPVPERSRVGAYVGVMKASLEEARRRAPAFDPAPFDRTLQAFYHGSWKLIAGSDGSRRLYDLARDPREQDDLTAANPEQAGALADELARLLAAARKPPGSAAPVAPDAETRARLRALGYETERAPN